MNMKAWRLDIRSWKVGSNITGNMEGKEIGSDLAVCFYDSYSDYGIKEHIIMTAEPRRPLQKEFGVEECRSELHMS